MPPTLTDIDSCVVNTVWVLGLFVTRPSHTTGAARVTGLGRMSIFTCQKHSAARFFFFTSVRWLKYFQWVAPSDSVQWGHGPAHSQLSEESACGQGAPSWAPAADQVRQPLRLSTALAARGISLRVSHLLWVPGFPYHLYSCASVTARLPLTISPGVESEQDHWFWIWVLGSHGGMSVTVHMWVSLKSEGHAHCPWMTGAQTESSACGLRTAQDVEVYYTLEMLELLRIRIFL